MADVAATESPMTITALAPWFGGKRTLAPEIVRELGDHRTYWEPFAGSMSVLMIKPPCSMETVNDLHGDLVNLARVIQHPVFGPALYRRLRRTLMHEDFLAESDLPIRGGEKLGVPNQLNDLYLTGGLSQDHLERAYFYFVVSWMGRNGCAGTPASHKGTFCVRYTNRGGHACKRWTGAVNSIPAWRRRMANVTILRRDAFELLAKIADDPGTAIYCDPPYLVKGASYLHDFTSDDHARLAELLSRFTVARIVVSYYGDPRLANLYPSPTWTKRRLVANKAMVSAGRRGNKGRIEAPEVLLINGPSLVDVGSGGLYGGAP